MGLGLQPWWRAAYFENAKFFGQGCIKELLTIELAMLK